MSQKESLMVKLPKEGQIECTHRRVLLWLWTPTMSVFCFFLLVPSRYGLVDYLYVNMGFKVYSFGSNGKNQLGFPHGEDLMVPQLTLSTDVESDTDFEISTLSTNAQLKKIACGGNHTVVLLKNGNTLMTGSNESGQLLGNLDRNIVDRWTKPDETWNFGYQEGVGVTGRDERVGANIEYVVDVACGWDFTMVATSFNKVYVRGQGLKGELGAGPDILKSSKFIEVFHSGDSTDKIQIFSSFQNCVILVTNTINRFSKVYGWGSNMKCQLWAPRCKSVFEPTLIYETKDHIIDYVSMGKDFMVYVDSNGSIVHTTGNLPKTFDFDLWENRSKLTVLSMWSSIHIIENILSFKISSYGFNMHNQLLDNDNVTGLKVNKVALGSEHGIMLCDEGDKVSVRCWGWGEHGNCGSLKKDKSIIINDRSNESSPLNQVMSISKENGSKVDIFGGCANTWIVISN